ncbi:DUF5627 domain-containing protein [Maribellus sp. YY47]|uniref:DUF5627 domain-containing protein n=1 Tax=Maribellus sp. YY47 TaxID=2929486 RepID=UPI002001A1AB|nr:DUF5627 domain-containing protein [Maribellus sp. YY47]MCK3684695.1 DUF5627 domain-containing protein [Maribellus sp. YY47]
MKQFKFLLILSAGFFALLMSSCENQEVDFPDYDFSAVYFPYQYPVRTIVLGEDIFDNTLDNEHKCMIYATVAGLYSNNKDITIDFEVDNSICDNLYYDSEFASPVLAMPSNYYSIDADQITLSKSLQGGIEVQLTEAFFADNKSLNNTYVIPLKMTNVVNADSILSGDPLFNNARRGANSDWNVLPKDYVLYCVKFINPYHANYLRRGKDAITDDGETTTNTRHANYVEDDELKKLTTLSLSGVSLPLNYKSQINQDLGIKLKLNFNDENACTISPSETEYNLSDTCRIYNITATGSGQYVSKGEKNSWGNKDRDALYLSYQIGYEVEINYKHKDSIDIQTVSVTTLDTLVLRDRGVTMETFSPSYKFD